MEERLNKREKRKGIIFLLLSILWMAVIFMFSAQTGQVSDSQSGFLTDIVCKLIPFEISESGKNLLIFIIRKMAHFTEYAILGILYFNMLFSFSMYKKNQEHIHKAEKKVVFKIVLLAASLCMLYAMSDEYHQSFSDGRSPAVRDVIIDTFGGFAGCLSAFFACTVMEKRKVRKR